MMEFKEVFQGEKGFFIITFVILLFWFLLFAPMLMNTIFQNKVLGWIVITVGTAFIVFNYILQLRGDNNLLIAFVLVTVAMSLISPPYFVSVEGANGGEFGSLITDVWIYERLPDGWGNSVKYFFTYVVSTFVLLIGARYIAGRSGFGKVFRKT